jgi:hypothetical protein
MADAITHAGRDRLDTEVITDPDGLEQRDADGRHPQTRAPELIGGGRYLSGSHPTSDLSGKYELSNKTNDSSLQTASSASLPGFPSSFRPVCSQWPGILRPRRARTSGPIVRAMH